MEPVNLCERVSGNSAARSEKSRQWPHPQRSEDLSAREPIGLHGKHVRVSPRPVSQLTAVNWLTDIDERTDRVTRELGPI